MKVSADPRIGSEVAGYRVERLLGRGGMSVVYLAEDLRLARRVALKLLAAELAEDERFRERFLRESRLAASLDHANVIPIYEAGEAEGVLYIAMRYVEGTDLKRLLEREGRLEPGRALDLLGQAGEALDTAHAHGLVHRDVKPGNMLIADQGGREHVYLYDFGLTKQTSSESGLTETGQFVGTADYVSPEQIDRKPADARSDLYSLGCVLYECLVGEAPYRSESLMGVLFAHVNTPPPQPSVNNTDLPEAIDEVVVKAMAKDPEERYRSCRELIEAGRAALPAALPEPVRRRRRPHWSVLAATAAALVAAAVAAVLLVTGGEEQAGAKPTAAVTVPSLQRIDPETNRLVATIPVGPDPSDVAVGEGAVWVGDSADRTVLQIDPDSNALTRTIATAGDAVSAAAGLGSVWVANNAEATLVQIDPRKGAITQILSLFGAYGGGPVAVGEGSVWVATHHHAGSLWRIDPHSKAIDPRPTEIPVFVPYAFNMAIGEGAVWLPHFQERQLTRIDTATNTLAARIKLEFLPVGVAAGEGSIWVTDNAGDALARLDPATNRITKTIAVGDGPFGVAVGHGSIWVVNHNDGTVSRVDPETEAVAATIEVGPNAKYIAVSEDGVWVTVSPR